VIQKKKKKKKNQTKTHPLFSLLWKTQSFILPSLRRGHKKRQKKKILFINCLGVQLEDGGG